jgi:hypothetical protein
MQPPDVEHRLRDEQSGVTYIVFAYRELEHHEVINAIRSALAHCKKKERPKPGQSFTVFTVLGAERS